MEDEYPPRDERYIRMGPSYYRLPRDKMTEKDRKKINHIKVIQFINCIMNDILEAVVVQDHFQLKQLLTLSIRRIKISNIYENCTCEDLKILKLYEQNGKNRKGVHKLIDNHPNSENKKKNNKKTAKADEDKRITEICRIINEDTPRGKEIKDTYYEKFGKSIAHAKKSGGLKNHYDILFTHTDGSTCRCEEKGTMKYHKQLSNTNKPWEYSVEFFNGPASKFSISKKYLRIWYDDIICDPEFKAKYNLEDIDFESWLKGGPNCIMTNPSGDFHKMFKEEYLKQSGGFAMGGRKGSNDIDYRIKINDKFCMNDEEEILLIKEVQEYYDIAMNCKQCWLKTSGDVKSDNEFSFVWYDKIEPSKIMKVDIIKNKDIEFEFTCMDDTSLKGHMRWGGGCGFSCFRMDLK